MSADVPGTLLVAGKFTNAGGSHRREPCRDLERVGLGALGPAGVVERRRHDAGRDGREDLRGRQLHQRRRRPGRRLPRGLRRRQLEARLHRTHLDQRQRPRSAGGRRRPLRRRGVPGRRRPSPHRRSHLVECDLGTGRHSTTIDPAHDFNGRGLRAHRGQLRETSTPAAASSTSRTTAPSDKVAKHTAAVSGRPRAGRGPDLRLRGRRTSCGRSPATARTSMSVPTASDIAGIAQADHVAALERSSWRRSGPTRGDRRLPPGGTSIDALFASGVHVYATGNWLNVGGDPTADYLADFDGTSWKPVGSDGAGDGALNAKGESFAIFGGVLHVGGNFTTAGGDVLAGVRGPLRRRPPPATPSPSGRPGPTSANGTAKLSVDVPGAGALPCRARGSRADSAQAGLRCRHGAPEGQGEGQDPEEAEGPGQGSR